MLIPVSFQASDQQLQRYFFQRVAAQSGMSPRQAIKEFGYLFVRGFGKEPCIPEALILSVVETFPVSGLGKIIPHFHWGNLVGIELIEQGAEELIVGVRDTAPVNIDQERPQLV